MKKLIISLAFFAFAHIAFMQTYNYNSTTKTLVISGSGPSSAPVILTADITTGNPVPGSSGVFSGVDILTLKDINAQYGAPNALFADGVSTITKMENAILEIVGDTMGGGTTYNAFYIDANSIYNAYSTGGVFKANDYMDNQGVINMYSRQYKGSGGFGSIYLADQSYTGGVQMTGDYGGAGNVYIHPTDTVVNHGILKYSGAAITSLTVSGVYTLSATGTTAYDIKGIWNADNDITMTMSGSIIINAPSATVTGARAKNFTGANDFSGTITLNGTTATGIYSEGTIDNMTVGNISAIATTGAATGIESVGDMTITAASGASIVAENTAGLGTAIKSGANATLSTTGTLNLTGNIDVAGTLTINPGASITFNPSSGGDNAYLVKAATLTGGGANDFAKAFYGITPMSATGLVGTYTPSATGARIEANITSTAISDTGLTGTFSQDSTTKILGWTITDNTYIQDNLAKTPAEKEVAKLLDAATTVDNGGPIDMATAAQKATAATGLSGLDMSAIVKLAHEQVNLADDIYRDTFFRAGRLLDTWQLDELESKLPRRYRHTPMQVGVSSVNRFGSASGDDGTSDYDFTTYGAMATFDARLGDFIVGGGIGGWAMDADAGSSGKAEATSIGINIYADWNFLENYDWFATVYYAHSMNTLKRNDPAGVVNTKYDGNLIGGMTGLRYNIRLSDVLVLKPFVGISATHNMLDGVNESGGSSNFNVQAKNYTSIKGLCGLELAYQPISGWYLSGRVMYAHEFGDNKYDMSMAMLGWGNITYTGYKSNENSVIAGVGVGYQITDAWSAGINYNAEWQSSKINSNINVNVGFRF